MRKRAKENLDEIAAMMRENGLFLAIYIYNSYPQLIVTTINPKKNKNAKAKCFFLYPFILPNEENGPIYAPDGIVELNIRPISKIEGIHDKLMNSFSSNLDKNIEKLKKTIKK